MQNNGAVITRASSISHPSLTTTEHILAIYSMLSHQYHFVPQELIFCTNKLQRLIIIIHLVLNQSAVQFASLQPVNVDAG